jgi:colicin import membrane protein
MSREHLTGHLLRTGWDRGLLAMVGFSLALHVVVVALLVLVRPWSEARSAPPAAVYTVELTSFTTRGSNAVPGAPAERLTGGRAEPAPLKRRVPSKPPVQVASKTPPPVEQAPIKIPPPPAPPRIEPPPVVADEPVPAPEAPKAPDSPAPEAKKAEAKAPEPKPEPEAQPDEPSEVPEVAAVKKVDEPEDSEQAAEDRKDHVGDEEQPEEKPEAKPEEKAEEEPAKHDEQAEEKPPARGTEEAKQPEQPEKPVEAAKQPAAPPQDAPQADNPAKVAVAATADDAHAADATATATEAGTQPADAAGEEETRYAAAIDRIRRRVEEGGGGLMGDGDTGATPAVGVAGPGGGNQVVGAEFLIYYNIMLSHIKRSWLWVGHDEALSVTVRFQVGQDGAIGDIRLEQASGDATYDESVVRAVERANPLPPPPEAHRGDFGDVKLTFRPGDLRQPG